MWPTIAKENNDHFPNMSRLVFVMEAQCVLCEARPVAFIWCKLSLVFGPRFSPRSVRVTFAVDKVAVALVSAPVLRFPQSVSFHQRSVLSFVFLLLLSEGQTGKPENLRSKQRSFSYRDHGTERCLLSHPFLLYELSECETLPVVSVHNCSMFTWYSGIYFFSSYVFRQWNFSIVFCIAYSRGLLVVTVRPTVLTERNIK